MASAEKMKDFFDERAEIYERHMLDNVEGIKDIYLECAKHIAKKPGQTILDLGCGTGLELEEVFHINPDIAVTGIDLSEKMTGILKAKYAGRQLKLITGSYIDVDFGEGIYDYVLSVMSLHHFEKADKAGIYAKVFASLKPGGAYIEADYTVPSPEMESRYLADYRRIKEEEKIQGGLYHIDIPFTPETQAALLKEAGFGHVYAVRWMQNATVFLAVKKEEI